MKPYPLFFTHISYISKLRPVIGVLSYGNSMRFPTVFRQPLREGSPAQRLGVCVEVRKSGKGCASRDVYRGWASIEPKHLQPMDRANVLSALRRCMCRACIEHVENLHTRASTSVDLKSRPRGTEPAPGGRRRSSPRRSAPGGDGAGFEFVEVKFRIRKTKFRTQVKFPTQTQVSDSALPRAGRAGGRLELRLQHRRALLQGLPLPERRHGLAPGLGARWLLISL